MPKWLGIVVQLLLLGGQFENLLGGLVPADYKWVVMGLLGALQVIANAIQSHYNPDGTPATAAYQK